MGGRETFSKLPAEQSTSFSHTKVQTRKDDQEPQLH